MKVTRREMMFLVGAAGAVVATPATLRMVARAPELVPPVAFGETSAVIRVPGATVEALGLRSPVVSSQTLDADSPAARFRSLERESNEWWYDNVQFTVVGEEYVSDPSDRDLYRRLVRGAVAYPGVTVPRTPIRATGARITDTDWDIRERAMYVTYRLWAAPVVVTKMVFHDGTHKLDMDVFYHTVEAVPRSIKNPWTV